MLCRHIKELVKQLSIPPPGSRDLYFSNVFSHNFVGQFKACLWKQNLSYWRNPSYNSMRFLHTTLSSLIFGVLFWKQAKKVWVFYEALNCIHFLDLKAFSAIILMLKILEGLRIMCCFLFVLEERTSKTYSMSSVRCSRL